MVTYPRVRGLIFAAVVAALSSGCASAGKRWDSLLNRSGEADESQGFSARLSRAEQALNGGKLDDARTDYEKLIADFGDRYEPYRGLALVADRQRRHREAQSLYAEAIRRRPQDPELFNNLGYSFYLDGQLVKAESALLKAVSWAPANQRFRNNLGLVLGQSGRHGEALEHFRKAGSEADAQYNLAFIFASQENIPAARKCFELALAADPNYAKAREALATFERYEKDPASCPDPGELVAEGKVWVPFVEGAVPVNSDQVMAAAGAAASRASTLSQEPGAVLPTAAELPAMAPGAAATAALPTGELR